MIPGNELDQVLNLIIQFCVANVNAVLRKISYCTWSYLQLLCEHASNVNAFYCILVSYHLKKIHAGSILKSWEQ
jgi:hypothetical protein